MEGSWKVSLCLEEIFMCVLWLMVELFIMDS